MLPGDILSHLARFPCSPSAGWEQLESICPVQKPVPCDPLSGLPVRSVCTGMDQWWARSWTRFGVRATLPMMLAWNLLPPLLFVCPVMFIIVLFLKIIFKTAFGRNSTSSPSAWAGCVHLARASVAEAPSAWSSVRAACWGAVRWERHHPFQLHSSRRPRAQPPQYPPGNAYRAPTIALCPDPLGKSLKRCEDKEIPELEKILLLHEQTQCGDWI